MCLNRDWCLRFSQCVTTILHSRCPVCHSSRQESIPQFPADRQAEAEWGPRLAGEAVSLNKLTFSFNPES